MIKMKFGAKRLVLSAVIAIVCLLSVAVTELRAEPQQNAPQMAEEVWPSLQLLRGIPVDEFWDTMGMFAGSLGKDCVDCHALAAVDNWAAFAEETPMIRTARGMIRMVNTINNDQFGGVQLVTCVTCHQGASIPESIPDLGLQYGVPPDRPNALQLFPSPLAPPADEIWNTYFDAIGGTQRLSGITSIVGTGNYSGYETGHQDTPMQVFSQAPARQTTVAQGAAGESVSVYDGTSGWVVAPGFPLPVMPLNDGKLANARLEARLAFPATLRDEFNQWRVGVTIIDDNDVFVVQGTRTRELPVNFYFDDDGLLMRVVYWNNTAMGMVPTQLDLEDYREVAGGVRMPFRWTRSWTTGQTTTQLTDVQVNVAIPPARFARPAAAQGAALR